jgi:hypothetical protein
VSTTDQILTRITELGYIVKRFTVNGVVELHAVRIPDGHAEIARCNDGNGEEETYRTACLLAHAVGIDLEDG